MTSILDACSGLPEVTFAPGEILITEGLPVTKLLILISGRVSVRKGTQEVASIHNKGAIFGEMSALLDIPASATVIAQEEVRALCSENGKALIEDNHQLAIHTARTLAQRLYQATTYLGDCKTQFADRSDHFGMMDQILDELMQQQRVEPGQTAKDHNDPRL